jgi:hypothetical protein
LLCLVAAATSSNAQETLFFDDFEDGMDPAWSNPDGGWVAEDGHLSVTTSCGFDPCNPNLYAGGPEYEGYVVSFEFMVTEAFTSHGSTVRALIALSDPVEPGDGVTSGYGLGFGWSSDGNPDNALCGIQRIDGSVSTDLVQAVGQEFWIEPGGPTKVNEIELSFLRFSSCGIIIHTPVPTIGMGPGKLSNWTSLSRPEFPPLTGNACRTNPAISPRAALSGLL